MFRIQGGKRCLRRKTKAADDSRRGATTVEMALVLPLVFSLAFGSIEFGRLLMAMHGLDEATREGCRVALLSGATTQKIQDAVANRMDTFGIASYTVTVDPVVLSNAKQWDPVTVKVQVSYANISWLPTPEYLSGITFSESCTMPRETDIYN